MRIANWSLLFLMMAGGLCFAQTKPLASVKLKGTVRQVFVDRPGDLYVQFNSGIIQKFDINGNLIGDYKPNEKLSLFDPRDGSRAFCYSSEGRWYSYAFFGRVNKTKLNEEFAIEPVMACSSGDKNIWIYDQADVSIKKVNTIDGLVDVEVRIGPTLGNASPSVINMREYQSFLFIHEKTTGLHIFNSLGVYLKTIPGTFSTFNFLGEELYYPHHGVLKFYDLLDGNEREVPIENASQFIILTDARTFMISNGRLDITPPLPLAR